MLLDSLLVLHRNACDNGLIGLLHRAINLIRVIPLHSWTVSGVFMSNFWLMSCTGKQGFQEQVVRAYSRKSQDTCGEPSARSNQK